ncbi:MAG: HDIG domain-containing protein [Desulfuromonadales bacterium]|nr:HDIG domain-containing protein [Desulfuromonadales bacterium]
MLQPHILIDRVYAGQDTAREILLAHSRQVATMAVAIARRLVARGEPVDVNFVEQAAWLHDIGVLYTRAPSIGCFGPAPYIRHGVIGARMLNRAGLRRHGLVCERHIGVGLSANDIRQQQLPLPRRDMVPLTVEEEIVAFADLFFSKTSPDKKLPEKIRLSLARHDVGKVTQFDAWLSRFGE